jgi:hypothetical protein
MKTKYIILLLSIILAAEACNKTPVKALYTSSLDSGSYACVVTYQRNILGQSGYYLFDTIIGLDTISFSAAFPSSLIQTGNFLTSPYDSLNGNAIVSYSNDSIYSWTDIHHYGRESVVFFRANDSMAINYEKGGSQRAEFYLYNGRKIH